MKILKYITILFIMYNSSVFGQARKAEQQNTDYLTELMNNNEINHIFIVGSNIHFEYSKYWLIDIVMDGDYITFKNEKENKIHSWDLSRTIFFEKYGDVIKIRLSAAVGK